MTDARASPGELGERTDRRCLELMLEEMQRTPAPAIAAFAFLAYMVWEEDFKVWASAWFAAMLALQAIRMSMVHRMRRRPSLRSADDLRRMLVWFAAAGVAMACIVPAYFVSPHTDSRYIATMVMIGIAAGALVSIGGWVRAMLVWGGPFFVALGASWALQGTVHGAVVAVLLALLLLMLLSFVRDQHRMIRQLVALAHEKETLAESLRLERDRAELANESKTRFFRAASHDLRQPLQALGVYATHVSLMATQRGDDMLADLGRGLANSLQQSRALVGSLLDLSKLDAGAFQVLLEPVDLARALPSMLDALRPQAAQRGLRWRTDLPDRDGGWWVMTDVDLLSRIVGNLVGNAIKFTEAGEVAVSLVPAAAGATLRVRDTGAGIAPQDQEKIFEEFYQVNNAARDRSQGLGIGLSIVRRATTLLHAPLSLQSRLHEGSCFEVTLPWATAPAKTEPIAADAAARCGESESERRRGRNVLVVDDEVTILDAVHKLFTGLGWSVRVAQDRVQALGCLHDGWQPEVLIVDYRLRNDTGDEVVAALHAALGPVPHVLLTGDVLPEAVRAGRCVLNKPLSGEMLIDVVCAVAAQGGQEREAS